MFTTGGKRRPAKVLFEYNATEDNQLSIRKGESITLIGDVTPENWVLAQNSRGEEGYIPDKYFEVSAGSPAGPPPVPSNVGGSSGETAQPAWSSKKSNNNTSSFSSNNNNNRGSLNNDNSRLMSVEDTYGLFAYQFEWFAVVCCYIGGILAFLYYTTQPDVYRAYFIVDGIVSIIMSTIIIGYIGLFRRACDCCGCGTLGVRSALFLVNALLLGALYPIGTCAAVIPFLAFIIDIMVFVKKLSPLPDSITDEWCGQMFGDGGLHNCSLGKLIVFFAILALDIAALGYGFSDGYNYAISETEDVSTDYYLNPTGTGLMYGFGRIITISMALIFLFGLFGFCQKQEQRVKSNNSTNTCCGKLTMLYAERNNRRFLHRCLGYGVVIGTFLHVLIAYFCYEDSSSTHSFYDIYGFWILVSGAFCMVLLSVVVGSSNETIADQNSSLFFSTHKICSVLLAVFLIFHGATSLVVSQFYWIFIIIPLIFYSCDVLYRYARSQ